MYVHEWQKKESHGFHVCSVEWPFALSLATEVPGGPLAETERLLEPVELSKDEVAVLPCKLSFGHISCLAVDSLKPAWSVDKFY